MEVCRELATYAEPAWVGRTKGVRKWTFEIPRDNWLTVAVGADVIHQGIEIVAVEQQIRSASGCDWRGEAGPDWKCLPKPTPRQ